MLLTLYLTVSGIITPSLESIRQLLLNLTKLTHQIKLKIYTCPTLSSGIEATLPCVSPSNSTMLPHSHLTARGGGSAQKVMDNSAFSVDVACCSDFEDISCDVLVGIGRPVTCTRKSSLCTLRFSPCQNMIILQKTVYYLYQRELLVFNIDNSIFCVDSREINQSWL